VRDMALRTSTAGNRDENMNSESLD